VAKAGLDAAQSQLRSATAQHDSAAAQRAAAEQQVKIVGTKGAADAEAARQTVVQAQEALKFAQASRAQKPAYRQGLAALSAAVQNARAAVAAAQARRADTVLACPLDGFVTARLADPGTMAVPGQPLLTVQSFGEVWVTFSVPAQVSQRLSPGQEATVTFDGLPGRSFVARIRYMNPAADVQGRQFTIRATLDNREGQLKPGMFARVSVVTERAPHVVTVPREAIEQDATGSYVIVAGDDGKAHFRRVTTGLAQAEFIAIASGLTAGEKIVTMSTTPLKDGQAIAAQAPNAKAGGRQGPPAGQGAVAPAAGQGPSAVAPAGGPGSGPPAGR
jgi:membrane fusion protein (multidrug efflux system)